MSPAAPKTHPGLCHLLASTMHITHLCIHQVKVCDKLNPLFVAVSMSAPYRQADCVTWDLNLPVYSSGPRYEKFVFSFFPFFLSSDSLSVQPVKENVAIYYMGKILNASCCSNRQQINVILNMNIFSFFGLITMNEPRKKVS